jgi:DNA-binding NtrC family response regulator
VRLDQGSISVGRDPDCDLVIDDPSVSRRHAQFGITPAGIRVEDLGSTNGIEYLGKRVSRIVLGLGSRVAVGRCWIDLLPLPDAGLPLSRRDHYGDLVGSSLAMRRVYSLLEALEGSDAPVLIQGETGTGKELVARALHEQGLRKGKPFVVIDCGNVQAELIESELFGHRRGSFTGAVADRVGAFETADGGTVFLDELGDLPPALQPKLLRVLETGQLRKLGDAHPVTVDVRIVAATKRDLAEEVRGGSFREDLFFRIAVVQVTMPPLRERREDIPALVRHLAGRVSKDKVDRLPPEAEELFVHHDWPGNVRELRNAVQRTLALGIAGVNLRDRPDDNGFKDPAVVDLSRGFQEARDEMLARFERAYLTALWADAGHNLSAAARRARLDRKQLRRLLRKHRLYLQPPGSGEQEE